MRPVRGQVKAFKAGEGPRTLRFATIRNPVPKERTLGMIDLGQNIL
jgi:hypothetical protein